MGRKTIPGLLQRNGVWHIDKKFRGRRFCESTGESSLKKAEQYLIRRMEEIRKASIYGIRPKRSFRDAAIKYVEEATKDSIQDDVFHLKQLDPFIGKIHLDRIHMGSLGSFIEARKGQGVKTRTINHALQVVRHILNLAATEWIDEYGLTWLDSAPKIRFLSENDSRDPYPLSWEEQERLFKEFPDHLQRMALFKVNTGLRENEVCSLKWNWEVNVPEVGTSIFLIPAYEDGKGIVKNRKNRVVVLNDYARDVVEEVRGIHPEFVFTYKGKPIKQMNHASWRKARKRAKLSLVRVHDLRHTFSRRLRSAGVSFEDRQDLLGHESTRITTHYSSAELHNLIEASNRICNKKSRKSPALVLLKKKAG